MPSVTSEEEPTTAEATKLEPVSEAFLTALSYSALFSEGSYVHGTGHFIFDGGWPT